MGQQNQRPKEHRAGGRELLGASFLMATSAIGPGFLTQTAVFTEQYGASLGFVILLAVLISLAAQLTIWTVLGASGLRAQDLTNRMVPGLGYFLAGIICLGGLAFNVGNIAGAALGLEVMLGLDPRLGMVLSALLAIGVFLYKEAGKAMDVLTKGLGGLMILLVFYVALVTRAPIGQAVAGTFIPDRLDFFPIVTLLGGTVGGYISFSGIHRLLDAGVTGANRLTEIRRSAILGISIASVMRFLLFLSVLGVVSRGIHLDPANPPASAFKAGAGMIGYRLFGIVLWSAAVTSVVGSAYTSVSFMGTGWPRKRSSILVIAFIVLSTLIFFTLGRPVTLLILAGSLNGLILPISLGIVLAAAWKRGLLGGYRPPRWLLIAGGGAALASLVAAVQALKGIAAVWR